MVTLSQPLPPLSLSPRAGTAFCLRVSLPSPTSFQGRQGRQLRPRPLGQTRADARRRAPPSAGGPSRRGPRPALQRPGPAAPTGRVTDPPVRPRGPAPAPHLRATRKGAAPRSRLDRDPLERCEGLLHVLLRLQLAVEGQHALAWGAGRGGARAREGGQRGAARGGPRRGFRQQAAPGSRGCGAPLAPCILGRLSRQ